MTAWLVVRAVVADAADRAPFDRWYRDEHLPDAVKAFGLGPRGVVERPIRRCIAVLTVRFGGGCGCSAGWCSDPGAGCRVRTVPPNEPTGAVGTKNFF